MVRVEFEGGGRVGGVHAPPRDPRPVPGPQAPTSQLRILYSRRIAPLPRRPAPTPGARPLLISMQLAGGSRPPHLAVVYLVLLEDARHQLVVHLGHGAGAVAYKGGMSCTGERPLRAPPSAAARAPHSRWPREARAVRVRLGFGLFAARAPRARLLMLMPPALRLRK